MQALVCRRACALNLPFIWLVWEGVFLAQHVFSSTNLHNIRKKIEKCSHLTAVLPCSVDSFDKLDGSWDVLAGGSLYPSLAARLKGRLALDTLASVGWVSIEPYSFPVCPWKARRGYYIPTNHDMAIQHAKFLSLSIYLLEGHHSSHSCSNRCIPVCMVEEYVDQFFECAFLAGWRGGNSILQPKVSVCVASTPLHTFSAAESREESGIDGILVITNNTSLLVEIPPPTERSKRHSHQESDTRL